MAYNNWQTYRLANAKWKLPLFMNIQVYDNDNGNPIENKMQQVRRAVHNSL